MRPPPPIVNLTIGVMILAIGAIQLMAHEWALGLIDLIFGVLNLNCALETLKGEKP